MAEAWQLLRLTVAAEHAELAQALLQALGTLGVEERPAGGASWKVRQPWEPPAADSSDPARLELLAYFESCEGEQGRAATLRARLPAGSLVLEERLRAGDWEERWRTGFAPLEPCPGLWIAPPWEPRPGALLIEPATAFGTGQHPSTLACLRAIARLARPGGRMLDVGCGTGILALLAARLGMQAEGVDCDAEAVRASHHNARLNGLGCRFDLRPLRALAGRYELVVANIFAESLVRCSADLARLCGEHLVLAGILAERLPAVERAFRPLAAQRRIVDGEWACLELRRP